MRERCLNDGGFDGFATHELLEFLLFYAKARGDTNETAHLLIERFGSLKKIFGADPEELMEIPGIGLQSALLLKLVPSVMKRYAMEEEDKRESFDTVSKVYDYFAKLFIGMLKKECVYLLLLNNRMEMIDCVRIAEGTVNASEIYVRKIHELVMRKNASSVVLAHNHPQGLPYPSENDVEITKMVEQHLGVMGVVLLEHVIVTERSVYPIMKNHCGMYRCSPKTGVVGAAYYNDFYDIDEKDWTFPDIFKD